MRGSAPGSRRRHPTAIVIGLLLVFIGGAVASVTVLNQSEGDERGNRRTATTAPGVSSTTTTTRGTVQYTVKRGDNLISIAFLFSVTQQSILEANQLANPDQLFEGQVLTIPPPRVVRLRVRPAKVSPGDSVEITLTGAQPNESVTFEIQSPTKTFTGPAHFAPESGRVTASYTIALTDPPGTYTVRARGDQITRGETTFVVEPAKPAAT